MSDFSTDSMRFKASERIAYAVTDVRAVAGSRIFVSAFERAYGPVEARKYDALARDMAHIATPYRPCSDLPRTL